MVHLWPEGFGPPLLIYLLSGAVVSIVCLAFSFRLRLSFWVGVFKGNDGRLEVLWMEIAAIVTEFARTAEEV